MRVYVVDDRELFLDALERRLEDEHRVRVVGRATTASAVHGQLSRLQVDVLVVGVGADDDTGIELIALVIGQGQVPAAVVLTAESAVPLAARAIRAGARGLVSRGDPIGALVDAVAAVHRGGTWLPNPLLSGVLEELQRAARAEDQLARRLESLTGREREVLALLTAGVDRQGIARTLFISAHTVRTHVQRILTKLQVHSQLEAVSLALRAGLRRHDQR